MVSYSKEELQAALKVVASFIANCENIQPRFLEGSSQASLLKNRIGALKISRALLLEGENSKAYSYEDLEHALLPIVSIINKTSKAQSKQEKGTAQFKRLSAIIEAMSLCKSFIQSELTKKVKPTN